MHRHRWLQNQCEKAFIRHTLSWSCSDWYKQMYALVFSDIDIPVLELESGQYYGDSAVFSAAMKWRYHHVTVWIISIITAEAVVILLLFTALPLKPWLKSSQILNHINVMRSDQKEFTQTIDLTIIFVNSISMTHPLQKTVKTS